MRGSVLNSLGIFSSEFIFISSAIQIHIHSFREESKFVFVPNHPTFKGFENYWILFQYEQINKHLDSQFYKTH